MQKTREAIDKQQRASHTLGDGILDIIKEWTKDNYWCGYDDMLDLLYDRGFGRHEKKELKKEIYKLKAKGLILSTTLIDEETNLFCGRGWVTCS